MALPTTYDETSLQEYMRETLGATASVLGLDELHKFTEAGHEVISRLNLQGASWTVTPLLRAFARQEAWRRAMSEAGADHSYSEDGASYNRDQVFAHCRDMYGIASGEVAALQTQNSNGANGAGGATVSVRVESVW